MKNQTIVCISPTAWSGLWKNRQQIMSRLARHNRVIFVEPGWNFERSYRAELRQNWRYFWAIRAIPAGDQLTLVSSPPTLPYFASKLPRTLLQWTAPLTMQMNAWLMRRHLRRVLDTLGVDDFILWLYEPRYEPLVGRLGEELACYYIYDEIADYAGNQRIRALIQRSDEALCRTADVVFASSSVQYQRRAAWNTRTYYVPNGVDFEHFRRALAPATPIPAETASLPRPVIGFVGRLSYFIDFDLLRKVALAYPNGSLVLVGPDDSGGRTAVLRDVPNVHLLGRRDLDELPGYLKAFDVALMPYRLKEHTLAMYPLKLHEYLAAGKPVVATPLPELEAFAHVIHLAREPAEFPRAVALALQQATNPQQIARRVAVAEENTWDRRVARIRSILGDLLDDQERLNPKSTPVHRLDALQSA